MASCILRRLLFVALAATPAAGFGQEAGETEDSTALSIAPAGVRRYEPGMWSTLSVSGTNKTSEDSEEFLSVYVGEGNAGLQYARQFWLPAGSRRQTFLPIRIPDVRVAPSGRPLSQIDAFYMRLQDPGDAETYQNDGEHVNVPSQPLLLDHEQTKSGILFRRSMPDKPDAGLEDLMAYEVAYKAREMALGSRILIDFGTDFIPPYPMALDALDQMIISGDRILNDSVGLANLRRWLQRGGRIWIMLDTTGLETVNALLGNEARLAIVDRVEVNAFEIETMAQVQDAEEESGKESWSSETPVDMVRVFAGTDDIQCRVDGWPVAFWHQVGDGEVLFTTIGPAGWVQDGTPTRALGSLATRLFQPNQEPAVDADAIEPLLNDQIGYRIPSRSLAAWVLGMNTFVVLGFGCWWARQRRLERLAWFVPIVSLAATAVFFLIGSRSTDAVPSTIAASQLVRVFTASHEAHVAGVSAVYSQESVELGLVAASGARAEIEGGNAGGAIQRIVWDDDGQAHWMNLAVPRGVIRRVESQQVVYPGTPPTVIGTFNENGFQARLSGLDPARCEDPVIAAPPAPAATVSLSDDGQFSVGPDDVLAPEQYVSAALLTDQQRSRQLLLRDLLHSSSESPFSDDLSLLTWTPPFDMGVRFNSGFEETGSALVSIPLQIERPAAGTKVRIPASFITLRTFVGRQGTSSIFNQRTGEWLENATKATRSQLHCFLPKSLVPLDVTQATVTIKINAPSRTLKIEGMVNGESTVLHERDNPNGVLRFVVDRPESLQVDDQGGLRLTIVVTETAEEQIQRDGAPVESLGAGGMSKTAFNNSTWQIDFVRVDVQGEIPE